MDNRFFLHFMIYLCNFVKILNQKLNMKKVLITLLLLCTFLFADAYKRVVNLKRKGLPINRELVMDPEAWYDTEEHIIDVTMHSVGVLTVYYADGETVHSVNNLTFDLNRVFCDKECNLIILETADGIVYEGYLQEEIK